MNNCDLQIAAIALRWIGEVTAAAVAEIEAEAAVSAALAIVPRWIGEAAAAVFVVHFEQGHAHDDYSSDLSYRYCMMCVCVMWALSLHAGE
jgi:hypothetical protein